MLERRLDKRLKTHQLRRRRLVAFVPLTLGLAGLAACSESPSAPAPPAAPAARCVLPEPVAPPGSCRFSRDCGNDNYCLEGRCVPFDTTTTFDPKCGAPLPTFPIEGLADSSVHCTWSSPKDGSAGVLMTPIVADIDADGKTEVVFVSSDQELVVLDGATCGARSSTPVELSIYAQVSAADLDGDGQFELIGVTDQAKVQVLNSLGKVLATSASSGRSFASADEWGAVTIANVDGKGPPELIFNGLGLRYENGGLTELYNLRVGGSSRGSIPVVADVDGDGTLELVTDTGIFDATTGVDKSPAGYKDLPLGFQAVAELDSENLGPEIVMVASDSSKEGSLSIYSARSGARLHGPFAFTREGGGPPTIGDFDGDGRSEIAVAGYDTLTLFDLDCAGASTECKAAGIRWAHKVQDFTSAVTALAGFDFNGDGALEVVYRDECWLRIFDGKQGNVVYADSSTSGTRFEVPLIADVDGDRHADLVITSDTFSANCAAEGTTNKQPQPPRGGITVYSESLERWPNARALWNQHYFAPEWTHERGVIEPTKVPITLLRSTVSPIVPAPDLVARPSCAGPPSDCTKTRLLSVELCNRGTAAAENAKGTFYEGDAGLLGMKLCTTTTARLEPGACTIASCDCGATCIDKTLNLFYRANDDRGEPTIQTECRDDNDVLELGTKGAGGVCAPRK